MQKTVYKTRRKLVLSIMLAVLAVLGLFVFAACSDDVTVDDIKKRGYSVEVTYDFQGGIANSKQAANVLVEKNSRLPEPRSNGGGIGIPEKAGYSYKCFYVAKTDEKGNVVRDEKGNAVPSDTVWNFKTDKVGNKDITLCAGYWDNYNVVLHYGDDYALTKNIDLARNVDGSPVALRERAFLVENYTFLYYDTVKDGTDKKTKLTFPYTVSSSLIKEDSLNINIWGKSLNGIYVLVKQASDLIGGVGESTNFYLMNDIDMGGASYDDGNSGGAVPKSYSGKFIGNGYTISNFKMTLNAVDREYTNFGIFRTLAAGAEITDITYKDFTLSCNLSSTDITTYNVGLLAGEMQDGAVVKNVKFDVSDSEKSSKFECLLGVGVSSDTIVLSDDMLVAQKSDKAVLQDCSASNITVVESAAVRSTNSDHMVYVKYAKNGDNIILNEQSVYALANIDENGKLSSNRYLSIECIGENKFVFNRRPRGVYDIEITVNNGELSATVTERS